MIPMSGTPYNNGVQDLATMMTFIAPFDESANADWWKKATAGADAAVVKDSLAKWSSPYLIRRGKEVIASQLPKKHVRKECVVSYPLELLV